MNTDFQPTAPEDHCSPGRAGSTLGRAQDAAFRILPRLEPWMAWSVAGYTSFLALWSFPGATASWLFVLAAILIGMQAAAPVRRPLEAMGPRALALICGACLLYTIPGDPAGRPAALFFFWLGGAAMYFALVLGPRWAAGVVAGAVLGFTVLMLLSRPDAGWLELGLRAAAALCPLLIAMWVGAVLRRPGQALEKSRTDASTGLYNRAGFHVHGNALIASCRLEKKPLAVVVFDCADLLEVRHIYGSQIGRQLLSCLIGKLTAVAGPCGIAARTGPGEFTVVMPGLGREKAVRAIEALLGSPSRIELDAGDSEIVLVPDFLARSMRSDSSSVEDLYQELRRDLLESQHDEQRRRSYLQRERERHTRPLGVGATAQSRHSPDAEALWLHAATTVPARLGA